MKNVLIAGCSIVESLGAQCTTSDTFFQFLGQPGAGNTLIAQNILHEMSKNTYDQVIVLWSGIKRIDIAVGPKLANLVNGYDRWSKTINDTTWISSGGEIGTWKHYLPNEIKQIFKSYYIGATQRYHSDNTFSNIIMIQSYLKSKKIPSRMSFIYDTSLVPSTFLDMRADHVFGQLDNNSHLYDLIDWTQFYIKDKPVYNWARDQKYLEVDRLHPTPDAVKKWLYNNFDLVL